MHLEYSDFLAHESTFAASDQYLNDWHQGIPWYGFWAVLVDDIEWLAALRAAHQHLQAYLLPGYARQAHITISASGLLHPAYFSSPHYNQQKRRLKANKPSTFSVQAMHLDSFLSAPYLAIDDSDGHLLSLRSLLGCIKADDEPLKYCPHITLGLYHRSIPCTDMIRQFQAFSLPQLPSLNVTEIAFCRYKTSQLQGPFEVMERFSLT